MNEMSMETHARNVATILKKDDDFKENYLDEKKRRYIGFVSVMENNPVGFSVSNDFLALMFAKLFPEQGSKGKKKIANWQESMFFDEVYEDLSGFFSKIDAFEVSMVFDLNFVYSEMNRVLRKYNKSFQLPTEEMRILILQILKKLDENVDVVKLNNTFEKILSKTSNFNFYIEPWFY
jgi:hypothetical protein